jgi:hypothetical protein
MHIYEVRPRSDHRGVDLISDVLPLGRLLIFGSASSNRITRNFYQPMFGPAGSPSFSTVDNHFPRPDGSQYTRQ